MAISVVERDGTGHTLTTSFTSDGQSRYTFSKTKRAESIRLLKRIPTTLFLPDGYPGTVTPDYLYYQTFNALQAFCSSLAGLIASRAVLEGYGVGNASASATQALLLTILQDIFSRVTTILAAYYLGTSLFPETKTFRFLADILNDTAITLDTLSPLLGSISLTAYLPLIPSNFSPGLRVMALCLSSCLRSLCGVAAGGSKASLTNHFASPVGGKGDVGDLNAKDASKETVLGLCGMLLGTLIVPYLTTRTSTYLVLLFLVASHLLANYLAVRGVSLRSLNRQRSAILWTTYRAVKRRHVLNLSAQDTEHLILSPEEVSSRERIFEIPWTLRDADTDEVMGHCILGSSLTSITLPSTSLIQMMEIYAKERYVLLVDPRCYGRYTVRGTLRLHACFKEGYSSLDQLKAWINATEIAGMFLNVCHPMTIDDDLVCRTMRACLELVNTHITEFMEHSSAAGWITGDDAPMLGSTSSVLVQVLEGEGVMEDLLTKKTK